MIATLRAVNFTLTQRHIFWDMFSGSCSVVHILWRGVCLGQLAGRAKPQFSSDDLGELA